MATVVSRNFACYTETVIRIAELRGNAAARGASRDLDVMPPGSPSRCAPRARGRALRILGGRDCIVLRIVAVRAPFVNVLADIEEPESIGRGNAHRLRPARPTRAIPGALTDGQITPRIETLLESAARGAFPFSFGG